MKNININIIREDLLQILPSEKETLLRYFSLIEKLNIDYTLEKAVNTEAEYELITEDEKEIYDEVDALKQHLPLSSQETKSVVRIKAPITDSSPDNIQQINNSNTSFSSVEKKEGDSPSSQIKFKARQRRTRGFSRRK